MSKILTVCWILSVWALQSGGAWGHHTRHERTRYVSGRNQIYSGGYPNFDYNQNYIPFVHYWERPLQVLESSMNVPKKLSSRPLFSWDYPVQISTYTPSKKTPRTENPNLQQATESVSRSPSPKLSDTDVSNAPVIAKELKTRSERLNRAKEFVMHRDAYAYTPKKKKSTNKKKSIQETAKTIRWRQADEQNREEFDNESSRKLNKKKKKKGRKNKKPKTDKNQKKNKTQVEMNDGVNEVHSKVLTQYAAEHKMDVKLSPCETLEEKCEHLCEEDNGKPVCVCFKGFVSIGNRCVDVNECETNNGGCLNGKCLNTIGSRKCICSTGFRLVDGTCTDVNECLLRNGHGPCQDRCSNTVGSYLCSCEGLPGTSLSSNKHTCEDNNECNLSSVGCSHSCISVAGRAFCMCPDGFELGDDWKTCHDIDECSNPEDYDVTCPFDCINTPGSYTCRTGNSTNDST